MRVVLDTNVIVSALTSPSSPAAGILDTYRQATFELVVSAELLQEYGETLSYRRYLKR